MGGNITIILTSRGYIPFDKCLTRSEVSQRFQVEVENILGFVSSLTGIALVKYREKHWLHTIERSRCWQGYEPEVKHVKATCTFAIAMTQ